MVASNPVNRIALPNAPSALDSSTTSTNYDQNVALKVLFPSINITYANGVTQERRDYLARMSRLIKRIRKCVPYQYHGYETLTTDIFKMYGSTTFVWIFLMYNGVHRLELIPGTTYKMPDISEIQPYLTKQSGTQQSNVGKIITIR